jgi:putative NADPH-quinone reductase
MPRGLIILSDPNSYGISHKLITPTIKHLYKKRGFDCMVIDLHKDGFNPMLTLEERHNNVNAITAAYKHFFKKADQIHFVSNQHLGGLSAGIEGFIEQVVKNNFAFESDGTSIKSSIKSKDSFFYVHSSFKNSTILNAVWFRIKIGMFNIFKSAKVFQSDLRWAIPDVKNKEMHKLNNYLIKKIFIEK